ncbi:hypothetical protein [Microcoleus sp. FACHB-1515]|uniref:hypothetical protein n=1 Tax=Cyanophyceae TaxID=3028117 RepID=UPI0018EFBA92|nr:hypothetical protein [Microcoleus sp. FACHB-1515]
MQQSSRSPILLKSEWHESTVEYGRLEAVGEFDLAMPKQGISVAFVPHDRVSWSVDGDRVQTTALPAGSVFLYANRQFVWHHREKLSEYVHLTLEPQLLDRVAAENNLPAPIALEHRIIFSDPTILHVAQLLRSEVVMSGIAGDLYVNRCEICWPCICCETTAALRLHPRSNCDRSIHLSSNKSKITLTKI